VNVSVVYASKSLTSVWVRGGTAGETRRITNHIETVQGRKSSQSIPITFISL
jgi:hypothetical protein